MGISGVASKDPAARNWSWGREAAASKSPTFLVLGKKGSHLSLSGKDWAFSLVPAARGSRLRMPVWFIYVLRAKAMGELEERRAWGWRSDPRPGETMGEARRSCGALRGEGLPPQAGEDAQVGLQGK